MEGETKYRASKKETVLSVHWRGPFTEEDLDKIDESGILYLATGRLAGQQRDRIQYCGITEQSICFRKIRHFKLKKITSNLRLWIGWLRQSSRTTRRDLKTAESILVYLWQFPLNDQHKLHPPGPGTLVFHWFDGNWKPLEQKPRLFKSLYDVISWGGVYWRTGKLDRWKNYGHNID